MNVVERFVFAWVCAFNSGWISDQKAGIAGAVFTEKALGASEQHSLAAKVILEIKSNFIAKPMN